MCLWKPVYILSCFHAAGFQIVAFCQVLQLTAKRKMLEKSDKQEKIRHYWDWRGIQILLGIPCCIFPHSFIWKSIQTVAVFQVVATVTQTGVGCEYVNFSSISSFALSPGFSVSVVIHWNHLFPFLHGAYYSSNLYFFYLYGSLKFTSEGLNIFSLLLLYHLLHTI